MAIICVFGCIICGTIVCIIIFTDDRCQKFDDQRCKGKHKTIGILMLISFITEFIMCILYISTKCKCIMCYKQLSKNKTLNNKKSQNASV